MNERQRKSGKRNYSDIERRFGQHVRKRQVDPKRSFRIMFLSLTVNATFVQKIAQLEIGVAGRQILGKTLKETPETH